MLKTLFFLTQRDVTGQILPCLCNGNNGQSYRESDRTHIIDSHGNRMALPTKHLRGHNMTHFYKSELLEAFAARFAFTPSSFRQNVEYHNSDTDEIHTGK